MPGVPRQSPDFSSTLMQDLYKLPTYIPCCSSNKNLHFVSFEFVPPKTAVGTIQETLWDNHASQHLLENRIAVLG